MSEKVKTYAVFSIRETKGRKGEVMTIWVRAGSARMNGDGSITVLLDVLPIDGKLHLRDVDTMRENVPAGVPGGD